MKSYKEFLNEEWTQKSIDELNLKNKLVSIGPMNSKIPEYKLVISLTSPASKGIKMNKAFEEIEKYVEELDPACKEYLREIKPDYWSWKIRIEHYTLEEYGSKNHKNIKMSFVWTVDKPNTTISEFSKLGLIGTIENIEMKNLAKKYNIT